MTLRRLLGLLFIVHAMGGCPEEATSSSARCERDSCPEGETCAVDVASGELRCFVAQDPLSPTACTSDAECGEHERCVDSVDGGRRCVFEGRDAGS
jgi:hypothetical protein